MAINTANKSIEPKTNQSLQSSSLSHPHGEEHHVINPSSKQLDLDGIRELILEMRI